MVIIALRCHPLSGHPTSLVITIGVNVFAVKHFTPEIL
jgi:hypothetical protein